MWRLYLGVVLVYLLFQVIATWSGSDLGQWGIPIAVIVSLATVLAAIVLPLSREEPAMQRVRALGFGLPSWRALAISIAIGAAMLAFYPIYGAISGTVITLRPGWYWYLPGLVAQGGIAEEVLFRGYLFGQLREKHDFWRASALAMPPFLIAHLYLFATMDLPIALAATLLSVSSAFPLARLYDGGRRTIWAPALLHFVLQAAPKLTVAPDAQMQLGVGWMAVAMIVPWIAFAVRKR